MSFEDEESTQQPLNAVFKVDEACQNNGTGGASDYHNQSNVHLNADLLLQNIYRSEEFFDMYVKE